MKKQSLLLVALFALSINACDIEGIVPKGPVVTETYSVNDFNKVSIGLPAKVTLVQVTENPEVVIEAHQNLFEVFEVDIYNKELRLQTNRNIQRSGAINVTIYTTELNALRFAGSGSFKTDNCLEAEELKVVLSGSGDIDLCGTFSNLEVYVSGSGNLDASDVYADNVIATITGSADMTFGGNTNTLDVAIGGSGNFHGFELLAKEVEANVTGSGNILVYAQESLNAKIAGSGNIRYKGNPELKSSVTGSGTIIKTN